MFSKGPPWATWSALRNSISSSRRRPSGCEAGLKERAFGTVLDCRHELGDSPGVTVTVRPCVVRDAPPGGAPAMHSLQFGKGQGSPDEAPVGFEMRHVVCVKVVEVR